MSATITRSARASKTETEQSSLKGSACDSHSSAAPRYLFYRYVCGEDGDGRIDCEHRPGRLEPRYRCVIWRPRAWRILPRGLRGARMRLKFLFRWTLDGMRVFAGPGFGAVLIYEGDRLVHYSGFTPRYWRFPFIANGDLQIGDTWTDPAYRGRGLASAGLARTVALLARPQRRLWYVVESTNGPSIRVAEKARFVLAAEGSMVDLWGFKLARVYVIRQTCADAGPG